MDTVLQLETTLNFLNDLFAKSTALGLDAVSTELNQIRHSIYYTKTKPATVLRKLQRIAKKLTIHG